MKTAMTRTHDDIPPLPFIWDGEAFQPLQPKRCDRFLVVGQQYTLVEWHSRSQASHNHQFARIAELWANLPEDISDLYPSPEHLRKRALVEAGFYKETITVLDTAEDAVKIASLVRAISEFAVVIVKDCAVIVREPMSQSLRSMGKQKFEESKQVVLEIIEGMIA